MNLRFAALILLASTTIFSCKKTFSLEDVQQPNNGPGAGPGTTTGTAFVKIVQGTNPSDDTTFTVSYDASKRIKTIVNTEWDYTFTIHYNIDGSMESVDDAHASNTPDNTSFTYDAQGRLAELYVGFGGERYTFEYTNGILSKRNRFVSPNGSGPALNLYRYYTYTFTSGNVTSVKEYSPAGALQSETTYTYTSNPNIFKPLTLMNLTNSLGMMDVADIDMYFNKNLVATSKTDDHEMKCTYTFNNSNQLTRMVTSHKYGGVQGGIYTWALSY